ncbi:MAG: exosortase U [Planctomycetia bacterium]|nr:exosortase U [Planctomycetia bacterium]
MQIRNQLAAYGTNVLAFTAFLPILAGYFWRLWSLPHYQLFPITLLGGAALLHRDVFSLPPNNSASFGKVVAGSTVFFLLLTAAIFVYSPWLAYAAFLGQLAVTIYRRGGIEALRSGIPGLILCLSLLRPPFGGDEKLIQSLQRFTAAAAGYVLDFLGVLHHLSGNVVELPGRSMLVEEACAGLTSLVSACSLTLFYCLWTRRSAAATCVLLLSAPVWTVIANVGRITAIAVLRYYWNIAADEGLRHDISGFIAFWFAILLIWSTDCWLKFFAAVVQSPPAIPPVATSAPVTAQIARPPASSVMLSARVVGALAWAWLIFCQAPLVALLAEDVQVSSRRAEFTQAHDCLFPPQDGSWIRDKAESIERLGTSAFGQFTERADYRSEELHIVETFDYPFHGWHELATCYASQGWVIVARSEEATKSGGVRVVLRMRHFARGRYGYCAFSLLDGHGETLTPPATRNWERIQARIRESLRGGSLRLFRPEVAGLSDRPAFQSQVFLEQYSEPDADATAAANAALERLAARAAEVLLKPATQSGLRREDSHGD